MLLGVISTRCTLRLTNCKVYLKHVKTGSQVSEQLYTVLFSKENDGVIGNDSIEYTSRKSVRTRI